MVWQVVGVLVEVLLAVVESAEVESEAEVSLVAVELAEVY